MPTNDELTTMINDLAARVTALESFDKKIPDAVIAPPPEPEPVAPPRAWQLHDEVLVTGGDWGNSRGALIEINEDAELALVSMALADAWIAFGDLQLVVAASDV